MRLILGGQKLATIRVDFGHMRDVMIFTYKPIFLNLWVKISQGSLMNVTFNAKLVFKNSGKNVEFCQKK